MERVSKEYAFHGPEGRSTLRDLFGRNRQLIVSFRPEDKEAGNAEYNYAKGSFPMSEAPGASVFFREGDEIYHSYSTYARGLDILLGAYNYLDLTPLGRNEADLPYGMAWVRHHDKYE